ncbi:ankyrin [Legionella nautarum]|uniref:Ankyrin n=1 Tax=Legionella nautarum TaxID=45070 RepID=A0A0W0WZC5_9GAMM|nr:DUF5617 domain-containing protein [Legionella nautarum]KTD37671.1 ankyrin [Legionella nautarum]
MSKRLDSLMRMRNLARFKEVLANECSAELLQQEVSNNGNNILIAAYYYDDPSYFEALLASPYCTPEVLEWATNPGKRTILHEAVEDRNKATEKLDLILNHRNFRREYFLKETSLNETPLQLAIYHNHEEAIKKIFNHRDFDKELLMIHPDYTALHYSVIKKVTRAILDLILNLVDTSFLNLRRNNATALDQAIQHNNPTAADAIIHSKSFNASCLESQNSEGNTCLDLVINRGNKEILETLLKSPYCTVDLIKQQNLRKKAERTRNEDIINLVKKHEGRESYKGIYQETNENNGGELEQATALLEDYSAPSRLLRFHWNRHHVAKVNEILQEIKDKKITNIEELLNRLDGLQETLPNQIGSLSRRIEFIKKEFAFNHIKQNEEESADTNDEGSAHTL